MERGSWLSGGHWGQRREKREDAEQAGKEGRVQGGKGKHRGVGSDIQNSLHQARLYARACPMSLF